MEWPKIKAESILEEEAARQKELEEQETVKLQVNMNGYLVGWAYIRPDGTFEAELHSTLMGGELRKLLESDAFTRLSIGPEKPVPPKPADARSLVSKDTNRTKLKRSST